jgi:hypothetical protein
MIYLLMHELTDLNVVTLVYEGQHYTITNQAVPPYEIIKARARGVKLVMKSAKDGRGWWEAQFGKSTRPPFQDCLEMDVLTDYYDLPRIKGGDEAELPERYATLLPLPYHMAQYHAMEAWQASIGASVAAATDDAVLRAAQLCTDQPIPTPVDINMLYGYDLDTVNKSRGSRPILNYEFNRWKKSTMIFDSWRHKLEMAAKIACDSIESVTLDMTGGAWKLKLRMVQVVPGTAALAIELPCGAALYYVGARIVKAAIYTRDGKILSNTRLARNVLRFMAVQMERMEAYARLTGGVMADYEKWVR